MNLVYEADLSIIIVIGCTIVFARCATVFAQQMNIFAHSRKIIAHIMLRLHNITSVFQVYTNRLHTQCTPICTPNVSVNTHAHKRRGIDR